MQATRTKNRKNKPRPGPVSAAEANARTELIIQTARDEFLANGFEDATLSVIAERCRISKTTLYELFESKEALFSHVVISSIAGFKNTMVLALDPRRPFRDVIRAAVTAILEMATDKMTNNLLKLLVAEGARFPAMAHLSRERWAALQEPMENYLRNADPKLSEMDATYLTRHLSNMAMGGFGCLLNAPSLLFGGNRKDWIELVTNIFVARFKHLRVEDKRF